ncbi:uncharacterized protein FOMMEDRAFT_164473 [Fomitiporia mediterranea MF3/22]|uniref:uncharacterized protein n=1 Tax=Fomitiporia mediterranea (strain MF3/22) TaxID=694068 RepID=UPI00044073FE|nr:uncharacterized protein FOMMEDRAFT_164473 [Fomitiporia mediterranea MF3/22]EJD07522.1 hypothetical protein FOMMEDRAFT_164473 [Fomitiporia mediterranea MF3/22]
MGSNSTSVQDSLEVFVGPANVSRHHDLALEHWERFEQSGEREELEKSINHERAALRLRPEGDPDHLEESIDLDRAALELRSEGHPDRSDSLQNLAESLHVEEAIKLDRAALELRPEGHPDRFMSLSNLAASLFSRYERHGRPEDLEEFIKLQQAPLNLHAKDRPEHSMSLGNLATSLWTLYKQHGRKEDLEKAIELGWATLELRHEANADRSMSLTSLASFLCTRYQQYGKTKDLEEAIELQRAALELCPEDHPNYSMSLSNLAEGLRTRYNQHRRSEDIEEAIELHRAALKFLPEGHPNRSMFISNLAYSLRTRYIQHQRTEDLEEAIELNRAALELRPDGHPLRYASLNNLATSLNIRYKLHGKAEDFEKSIELKRLALELQPEGHPERSLSVINLASALRTRYQQNGRIEDLEESIKLNRAALKLRPEGHPDRTKTLRILADSLYARIKKLRNMADFEECMELLGLAATHKFSGSFDRLLAARHWAALARFHEHDTTYSAYKETISILQHALTVNPTLQAQHDFLLRSSESRTLAMDAASYAVEENQLEQAMEIFEQGRGLLWSQLRGFRTPLDKLAETNKELADGFRDVSGRLENLATSHESIISGLTTDANGSVNLSIQTGQKSFDKLLKLKRQLSDEQEVILREIRRVPGFESFLEATPFKTLQQAALEGPVIVINHSTYRSDALIVLSRDDPLVACVPLDDEFYEDSTDLCNELVESRQKFGADSPKYDEKLREAMEMLWDRVLTDVVDKLTELGVAKGSRIWWCPTSVLSALPFHAAGPFEDEHGTVKYLLDDYVSSYTPTLGALANARLGGNEDDPTVLVIGDTSLRSAKQEISNIRNCGMSTKLLVGKNATHDGVIKAVRKATWVHFVCHGSLDPKPFGSSFNLSDRGLTMLDVVQSSLPNAEFAFLSACHTAEQHRDSAHDEVLHLAAAMQFSGFRSVIGSMWELLDTDGPAFARTVYEYINDCEEGEAKYKRAAGGLRKASLALKARDGIQAERWVNLVHIGA